MKSGAMDPVQETFVTPMVLYRACLSNTGMRPNSAGVAKKLFLISAARDFFYADIYASRNYSRTFKLQQRLCLCKN